MDFEFEVVGGLRLSDGAILVVDVVEGVSSQTLQLLKRAIECGLELVLFLNKIDKLFSVLKMSSEKIHERLSNIIQTINAYAYKLLEKRIESQYISNEPVDIDLLRNKYRVDNYFDPVFLNVCFGSVIDGWGF